MSKIEKNNHVTISGEIISNFGFSHELYGEKFYIIDVRVTRLSGNNDIVPIMVSERLVDVKEDHKGLNVMVQGQYRSYNCHEECKNRLVLSVFAREIEFVDEIPQGYDNNQIYLDGYICKEPIYRKTPLGREITDLLFAVNRTYGKSDYIPCICWGRNAGFAGNLSVGTRCGIWGRIQSREYTKKLPDGQDEKRMTYEVSVSKMEVFVMRSV